MLVLDKPSGLITAPPPREDGPGGAGPRGREDRSVFGFVKHYVKQHRGREARAWIIHRLDREASGLLVFAKTQKAFEWLKEDFRAKRVHRIYHAVVEGEMTSPDGKPVMGTVQNFVEEDADGIMRPVSDRTRRPMRGGRPVEFGEGPKLAVTHYRVVAVGQGRSLLQLRLETGRKNQIRVHMKELGRPIVGDDRYGARTNPLGRLGLHACELGFTHPKTGQTARFFSPTPASFYQAVGQPVPDAAEKPAEFPAPVVETPKPPTAAIPAAPKNSDDAEPAMKPRGPVSDSARATIASRAGGTEPAPRPATDTTEAPTPALTSTGLQTSWDHVAGWYDRLVGEGRSDHHENVIVPGTLRLVRPARELRVLDLACGEGLLARRMTELGVEVVGVDASPKLVEAARRAVRRGPSGAQNARFEVGDARRIGELAAEHQLGEFDVVSCVMALMNIEPIEPVLRGAASVLKPGGAFVAVILHPAFRSPGQTSWAWEKPGQHGLQYRRVDGYLSIGQSEIVMNPGRAAHGGERVTTWTFHRPIQAYVKALASAGLLVESLEEWPSLRHSKPGPKAREENRARKEIPMFLGVRAVKK